MATTESLHNDNIPALLSDEKRDVFVSGGLGSHWAAGSVGRSARSPTTWLQLPALHISLGMSVFLSHRHIAFKSIPS